MAPEDLKYTKTHEWVKVEGDIATIGITDFAVEHLSDLVYIDLPDVGDGVTAGSGFGEVESVKAVADLNAPVDGEIVEVNAGLSDNLEQVTGDPFGAGWMIRVQMSNPSQVDPLLNADAYQAHNESEDH